MSLIVLVRPLQAEKKKKQFQDVWPRFTWSWIMISMNICIIIWPNRLLWAGVCFCFSIAWRSIAAGTFTTSMIDGNKFWVSQKHSEWVLIWCTFAAVAWALTWSPLPWARSSDERMELLVLVGKLMLNLCVQCYGILLVVPEQFICSPWNYFQGFFQYPCVVLCWLRVPDDISNAL